MGEFAPTVPQEELPKIIARGYRQDEVISAEMEADLEPISPDAVGHLTTIIDRDYEDFRRKVIPNRGLDWHQRFSQMDYIAEKELQETDDDQEKEIIRAFWGMSAVLGQVPRRNQLRMEHDRNAKSPRPDYRRQEEIRKEFDALNITASDWQNSVCRMVLSLSSTQEGRAFISRFWQSYEGLAGVYLEDAKTEAQHLRNGILGQITAIRVLETLGVKTYFSHPDQDALQKIDLWGARGGKVFAFQIKSHSRGNLRLFGEHLTTPENPYGATGKERHEIEQRNLLLTKAQEYGKNWGTDVFPFWIDLDHPKGESVFQNESTGFPVRIPPGIQTSGLSRTIQRLTGGTTGATSPGPTI